MKFLHNKALLSFLLVIVFLTTIVPSNFMLNSSADGNNNWVVGGTGDKVTLSSIGSATNITFGAGYDWSKSYAHLPNKLLPIADKTFAFKFKATNLTGGWVPFILCWSANSSGSLMSNGLFFNVTSGNLEMRNCAEVAAVSNATAIANVPIDTAQSHVVSVKLIDEATSTITVSVDGTEVVRYQSVSMAGQLKFAFTDTLQGLTLCVGGSANSAITIDTNATLWDVVGNASQLSITGDTNIANLNFTGGDHTTVYGQISNKFKPFTHGSFGYTFNLKSLSSWAVLMTCWSVTNNSPASSNSGVFLVFNQGGSSGYEFSVKKLASDTTAALGPFSINLNTNYKIIIECDASSNISIYLNSDKLGTYMDTAISNALILDFPYEGSAGLTLATGGSGAYMLAVDTSSFTRTKAELLTIITESGTLGTATAGNAGTPEYGQVTEIQKTAFTNAIAAAQLVYDNGLSTSVAITSAYETLKSAKILFASQIIATPDKSALQTKYNESKSLYDNTAVGSTYGKVSQGDKDAFLTALNSAKSILDSKTAAQAAVNEAVTAISVAKDTFSSVILKAGDPTDLRAKITAAQLILVKLTVGSSSQTALSALITSAEALANNVETAQAVLNQKELELDQAVLLINNSTKYWTITPVSGTGTIAGITATADAYRTTITSVQGAPSWGDAIISTPVLKTNKLVFNVNEKNHAANDWSCITVSNGITGDILHTKSFRIVFGGSGGNGEIDSFVSLSDPKNKQVGSFAYAVDTDVQFMFTLSTVGAVDTVSISVDGVVVAEIIDADFVNIFKNDLTVAYTSGNANGLAKTQIDLKPAKEFGYGIGDFAPNGMAGTGYSSNLSIVKSGESQNILFYEGCTFTEGIAKTIIEGPLIEFSLKIAEQGQTDWHALLFSDGIETHAANTKGLTITFGGDLSVAVKQYGQSGMGGSALWESADGGFTQVGKKMRFKIYEDKTDGNLVVVMNDKIIAKKVAPEMIALLKSNRITMTLFGSGDMQSQYEISYLNKPDPVPFDSLEPSSEDLEAPVVVSLDDTAVTVSESKVITILANMTIEELQSYLNVGDGYLFKFFGADGQELTDLSQSASMVKKIGVYLDDISVDIYTVLGDNPQTGNTENVNFYLILIILSLFSIMALKKEFRIKTKLCFTKRQEVI